MPPGPPPDAPRCPPGPPRTTQNFFRSIWPNNLFRKNRKLRTAKLRSRREKSNKKSTTVTTVVGPSSDATRCPPGPPWTTQNAFPKHLAQQPFSEKSKKSKSSKTCRKKSRQRSSTVVTPHNPSQKPKALSQRSNPRGWRRWSREALFNPPPPAQHGVLRVPLEHLL